MKKIILVILAIVLFTACNKQQTRYTQNSSEIDSYKKVIKSYEKRDWEAMASHYADTAKIMNNATKKNAQTITQLIATNKEDAALFTKWEFVDDESEYEMVVDDKGKTWVNFWGVWQGDLASTGKKYEIPVHLTVRFVNGKIIEENGFWDNSKLVMDLQQLETSQVTDEVSENVMQ